MCSPSRRSPLARGDPHSAVVTPAAGFDRGLLAGKKVIVVGGSAGMGLATAELAIACGATVIIAARSPDRLALAAERLAAQAGRPVKARRLSIEDRNAVRRLLSDDAPFDHLVLPGSTVVPCVYDELTEETARSAFDSKFWGPFWAVFDASSKMRPGGSVVLYSGLAAVRPVRGYVVSAAINGAIDAITRSLALEFGRFGLRVNAISPGFIDTPLWDRLHANDHEERRAESARRLPVGRVGTAEEAAAVAVLLMTNGFMTGQVIRLDGGATALP